MRFRLPLFATGLLLTVLGAVMLFPALLDFTQGEADNAGAFFISACMCLFFGGALFLANRGGQQKFNVRDGFMLTTLSWLMLSLAGALPLYLSDLHISMTDAIFESLSGITTTGSTILSGLDGMSHGVLLWRSLLQWIGGIGIIAFGIILLPFLKIGGMQLFQAESSDRSDKIVPQFRQLIGQLVLVYVTLTFLCFSAYKLLGMTPFDAINHAMTTLSTGGYSTHDASFGYFESNALKLTATFFMLLGGLPFILFLKYFHTGKFIFHKDDQVRTFVVIFAVIVAFMTLWLTLNHKTALIEGFVSSAFNVISVLTTTGYAISDYTTYGIFITAVFFFITYLGGCAGSTAGGLKVMRLSIAMKATALQIKKLLHPHGVFVPKYQGKVLKHDMIIATLSFLALYVISNVFLTVVLMFVGLDYETALSGAATAIANVGPGIGDIIGPAGNFSTLPDSAKWLLCLGMFAGRLEILTVIVVFHPYFWRL